MSAAEEDALSRSLDSYIEGTRKETPCNNSYAFNEAMLSYQGSSALPGFSIFAAV